MKTYSIHVTVMKSSFSDKNGAPDAWNNRGPGLQVSPCKALGCQAALLHGARSCVLSQESL